MLFTNVMSFKSFLHVLQRNFVGDCRSDIRLVLAFYKQRKMKHEMTTRCGRNKIQGNFAIDNQSSNDYNNL